MARGKFGPNSSQVEAYLKALNGLSAKQWEQIQEAAPPAGSVPELEVAISPGYFRAAQAAARLAKNEVFPGAETAYFDALRQAHQQAAAATHRLMPETLTDAPREAELSVDGDPEAITELMSDAFAGESWQRATSATMLAAGALVLREHLDAADFAVLWRPLTVLLESLPVS